MMYRWDGGFIMASWDDFDEGVEWYVKHFGWECTQKFVSPVGKKAFMRLPGAGMVTLKSFEADYEHFQRTGGDEGNVRLCFEISNADNVLAYFKENDIRTTEVVALHNGLKIFDVYAFEDARITLYENPEAKQLEGVRVNGYGKVNTRIGVTDIHKAAEWYQKHLGFILVEANADQGYAHLQTEDAYDRNALNQSWMDNIYLEKIEQEEYVEGDPSVRTYFDIRPDEFFDAYNLLIKSGIKPSQIAGNPMKGWGGFHIYDPDGNRINVWSYQMM